MPMLAGHVEINTAQITLPLFWGRHFSFENYFIDQSSFVITSLKRLIDADGERMIGLWGGQDSGKTHLLNASAFYARERGSGFQLYDGLQLVDCDPAQFDGIIDDSILAIDNMDAVCGCRSWEMALYRLINQSREQNAGLIFSLSTSPQNLTCALADFQSRLSWGLLLELPMAQELDVENILRLRAQLLGIDLSDDVCAYLLSHYSRQLGHQMEILRKLDKVSLSTKRKITIPFIKQVLS